MYDPALDEVSLVANAATGAEDFYPMYMVVVDGKLFMRGQPSTTGGELYVYDPVLDEVNLAAQMNSGPDSSYPSPIDIYLDRYTVMGDRIFFTADNGTDGYELYNIRPGGSPVYAGDMNPGPDEFVFTD